MEIKSLLQTWKYSKKFPNGAPVFFVNGKRVTFQVGLELVKNGHFKYGQHLKEWLKENGFIDSEA
jgi:hypothetical protein